MTRDDRKPRWQVWMQRPEWELWEAVALSLNIEPEQVVPNPTAWMGSEHPFSESEEFRDRLETLRRNLENPGVSKVGASKVRSQRNSEWWQRTISATRFVSVATQFSWPIPEALNNLLASAPQVDKSNRWPWGDYETKLLNVLAEAVHQWWSTYDENDPDTAPRQSDVSKWIEERLTQSGTENAGTLAGYMAIVIRHENAPVGRRKSARGK